jgi:enoyl-CoA hydratase
MSNRVRARSYGGVMAPSHYNDFEHLAFDRRPDGVVVVTLNRPEVLNAANVRLHREMSEVWAVIDADRDARVSVVTGAGRAFSAGGDLDMIADMTENYAAVLEQWRDARKIVECMLSADKPVVSAINGVAVGAGLAVALMADISIMGESARVSDGHARLGVAAGDHAALLWPLLCGLAKAKYYLLTADFIARHRETPRGGERDRRAVDEAGHEPLDAPSTARVR